jgi:hypothetical protein
MAQQSALAGRVCALDSVEDLLNLNPIHGVGVALDLSLADACAVAQVSGLVGW